MKKTFETYTSILIAGSDVKSTERMKRTVILLILDGWGEGLKDKTNPIHVAQTPAITFLREHYLSGLLQASGIAVGLPWGEEGNSEVGHLTIGAGRTVYQHLPRITKAIQEGEFPKNEALLGAARHAAGHGGAVHIVSLLSEGNVHASMEHIVATIGLMKGEGAKEILVHAISDGKDSAPRSALSLLAKLPWDGTVRLASLSGRYYAMDRNRHLDRTARALAAILGTAPRMESGGAAIEAAYAKGLNDEFIEPVAIGAARTIASGDAVVFCDFREDGIRQLASAFSGTYPKEAPAVPPLPEGLYVATMTRYETASHAHVAFPPKDIVNTLGDVIAASGKSQMRIAETEKYAHITYFFNGLRNDPLPGEYRVLVPSESIARHDERPEMMTAEIANRALAAIEEGMDFVLVNFAAPDMIAHTGNFEAAMRAVRAADRETGNIAKAALARGAALIVTADHGNVEQMRDPQTGMPETRHNPNPVPVCLVGSEFGETGQSARRNEEEIVGVLADLAPTVLALMGLPKPAEMTGGSLIGRLS